MAGSLFFDELTDENLSQSIQHSLYSFSYDEETGLWDAYNLREEIAISTDNSGEFNFKTDRGSFQMALAGFGRGVDLKAPGEGTLEADGRSLGVVYDGLTEWYKNKDDGIEHGMTVLEAPQGDGNLVAGFIISGDLRLSSTGDSIYLSNDDGRVFEYGGIKAWDSSGKTLDSSIVLSDGSIFWEVDDRNAVYPVYVDPVLTQIKILIASDEEANENLGRSVAIFGDIAVVGADSADLGGRDRGQAYIFYKDQGGADNWGQVKILNASQQTNYAYFGHSVAVSGDIVVVGAYRADPGGTDRGEAHIYYKDQGGADNWGQVKNLTASDQADYDYFGYSVAVSGNIVVVGAYQADSGGTDRGQAYVFSKNSGGADNWGQIKILSASDKADYDYFGRSVAIDNETALVGAYKSDSGGTDRGEAHIYYKDQGGADNWGPVKILSASDKADGDDFGYSVSVDNETAVVGARVADSGGTDRGQAYVFSKNNGGADYWGEDQIISAPDKEDNDQFGYSVSFSGDTAIFGAPFADFGGDNNCGKAYIFINASPPTFTGIVPSSALSGNTSVNVTITGTNYYAAPVVKLKKAGQTAITATGVAVTAGNTTLTCSLNLTGAVAGLWDIQITNPDTKSVTGAGVFTVEPIPIFTSINPNAGANYDGECPVQITGSSFAAGVTVKIKNNAGTEIEADNETLTGTTQIDCILNLTGAAAGSDWDVIITNTDGGIGTAVDAFTVTGPQAPATVPVGGTSSGGGGSNSDTGVGAANNVKAGGTAYFNFEGKGSVEKLSIEVNEDTPSLMVTVTKEGSLPSSIDNPETEVYQYEEVKTYHIDPSAISGGTFEFSVDKSWLSVNGYTMGDVVMLHYKEGEWVHLPTEFVREEGGYYYYTAETPSFSWFAIGIEKEATIISDVTPEATAVETTANAVDPTLAMQTTLPETSAIGVEASVEENTSSFEMPIIMVLLVILAVVVVAGLWGRKQKEKYPDWWDKNQR